MNESDFENELRALRPAAPSPELEQAIARDLAAPLRTAPRAAVIRRRRERISLFAGLSWAFGGAVLATVCIWLWHQGSAAGPGGEIAAAETSAFVPTETTRELIATEDAGVFFGSEGEEPAQAVRYSSIERHGWTNPTTGARIEVEVPRVDVVFLPVSIQ
jgi:hypothetical protein